MKGYFDDEERQAEESRRDTELTLGWGMLVTIFLGVVLICVLCFALGYAVGHHGSAPAPKAAAQPAAPTAAPDEEPLQASGSIPKPSAEAQAPVSPQPPASDGAAPASAGANPAGAQPGPSSPGQNGPPVASAPAGAAPSGQQPQVRPALAATPTAPQPAQPSATQNVRPAMPSGPPLMVQIAAVLHVEDANVLANALRKRGYAVTARRDPGDGMIHVSIGPFYNRDEANRWRDRLLGDGYNAVVQP